jgi:hypothetical protein
MGVWSPALKPTQLTADTGASLQLEAMMQAGIAHRSPVPHSGTMPTRPSEQLEDRLARLSPYQRALIELSLRRGISDDEIAGLLRTEPAEVERRREDTLERLAGDLDAGSASDLADFLTEGWGKDDSPPGNGSSVVMNGAPDVTPAPERTRRWGRRVLLVALVAAAAGAAVPALSGRGEKTTHSAVPVEPMLGAPPPHPATLHPIARANRRPHPRRTARAHPRITVNGTSVTGCHIYSSSPSVLISSARTMSCENAAQEMKRYGRPIYRRFQTPGRFRCFSVSGTPLGGQWRCVRAGQAFRFDFGTG